MKNPNPIESITTMPAKGSGTFKSYRYWTGDVKIRNRAQLKEALRVGCLVKRQEKDWMMK